MREAILTVLLTTAMLAPATGAWAKGGNYVPVAAVDLDDILPPPPAPGSAAQIADMQAVLAAQEARTPHDVEQAMADFKKSIFRFKDVLGPNFTPKNLPFTNAFFRRVLSDDEAIVSQAKDYFARPRPFITNSDVNPIMLRPGGGGYPSGHSTFAYVAAVIVSMMVPEKRDAIFARADQFEQMRVISGEHYPTDVEAGRIAGGAIANAFIHSPKFMADLEISKAEVRKALGLKE
ncbi:MAG: phosphatase PAP2 family protein [Proteobacteria bacterium]|nr:phosphatase PAP2 family protein [Pseudomonadota bacterium]